MNENEPEGASEDIRNPAKEESTYPEKWDEDYEEVLIEKKEKKMDEIKKVKELGEKIGYGNMMSITSALWRKSATEQGYPISGTFVPTCLEFIKEDLQDLDKISRRMYDKRVSEY